MNTVIERFIRDATEDDYAPAVEKPDSASRRAVGSVLVLMGVGALGIVTALAVIATRASLDERQGTRAELVSRVVALSERMDRQQEQVAEQGAVVEALQQDLLSFDEGSAEALLLQDLGSMSAITEVSGPGVVVTIDDAPDAEPGSLNRVLDRDIQSIVNELWRAGAVGIAVNDQRLTQATAIRGAGEAILVNYHPLNRPYAISAVGPLDSIGPDSAAGGLQQLLDDLGTDYGLVSTVQERDVTLPEGEVRTPGSATTSGDSQ